MKFPASAPKIPPKNTDKQSIITPDGIFTPPKMNKINKKEKSNCKDTNSV